MPDAMIDAGIDAAGLDNVPPDKINWGGVPKRRKG